MFYLIPNMRVMLVRTVSVLAMALLSVQIVQAAHEKSESSEDLSLSASTTKFPHLLHTAYNEKFRLKVLFYKDMASGEIPIQGEPANYVIIADEKTGSEVRYKPIDEPSIVHYHSFFKSVWSRDEEYLVLPLGRYDGFCILHVKQILRTIIDRQCNDFVRVQRQSRAPLWHKFAQWEKGNAFHFVVGDENSEMTFVYKIKAHSLLPVDTIDSDIVGQNSKGLIVFEI